MTIKKRDCFKEKDQRMVKCVCMHKRKREREGEREKETMMTKKKRSW